MIQNIRNKKKYLSTSDYSTFTSNALDAKITPKKFK